MSYNRLNFLQKVIDIQTIYLKHKSEGKTGEHIFHKVIHPIYYISRTTFYNYLGLNAKKELKELKAKIEETQGSSKG